MKTYKAQSLRLYFCQKPEELKTPFELALSQVGWKGYESSGKPYYVGPENNTVWELPADVKAKVDEAAADIAAKRAVDGSADRAASGANTPINVNGIQAYQGNDAAALPMDPASMQLAAPGQFVPGQGIPSSAMQNVNSTPGATPVNLDFDTKEEAERAFMGMLRAQGVTTSWTWEQVLRATVTQPLFRALKTLGERKAAFEKYCDDIVKKERDAKERSLERNRPSWRTALGRMSEGDYGMKAWWSWEHAAREIRERMPDVWRMSRDDTERETLWREYMGELTRKEATRMADLRKANIDKLAAIFGGMDIGSHTRFVDVAHTVRQLKIWREDSELQVIDPVDFLIVYEEAAKKAEQEEEMKRSKQKIERQRNIRKNRQAYSELLLELKSKGKIQAGTKWKEVFPIIQNDVRFNNMLGNPGSSPLDLFWDVVDEMDARIEEDTRLMENVASERGVTFDSSLTFQDWDAQLADHPRLTSLKVEEREAVFKALQTRAAQQARDERRRAERKLRHQIDDLRYALKKLNPPLDSHTTYEQALVRMQDLSEFKELEGQDDARKAAFDKNLQRLKDRLGERDRGRNGYGSDTESTTSRSKRNKGLSSRVGEPSLLDSIAPASPARSRDARSPDNRDRDRAKDRDTGRHESDRRSYKSREAERDRETEQSRGRDRERSPERDRENTKDKARERDRDRERGDDRQRDRERERERDSGREKDKKRNKESERETDRNRERDRERDRESRSHRSHRDDDRVRDRSRDRTREKDSDRRRDDDSKRHRREGGDEENERLSCKRHERESNKPSSSTSSRRKAGDKDVPEAKRQKLDEDKEEGEI